MESDSQTTSEAPPLSLRLLRLDDENEARQAHRELQNDDFEFLLALRPNEPWADYLQHLDNERRGVGLAPGRVPATLLVAEVAGRLVGRVSIRHELNDGLRRIGGHIGYGVRPQFRRRGYATQILRQSLGVAHRLGIGSALVTCDDGNLASARAIEAAGGVLEDITVSDDGSAGKRRYWVPTPA